MPYVTIHGIGKSALASILDEFDNVKVLSSDLIHHDAVIDSGRFGFNKNEKKRYVDIVYKYRWKKAVLTKL